MNNFWLFRSNIKHLEYYHKYDNVEDFERNCHDFYMLFPIWLLRAGHFGTVVIWRLSNSPPKEIVFNVDGYAYIQRWVRNFSEVLKYPKPDMSFFRGGFKEYDTVTKLNPEYFGLKIYLATGRRTYPQWGGKYDLFVQEDQDDFRKDKKCQPFFKTASPDVFRLHPWHKKDNDEFDICWPCNFKQIRYKGQEQFIKSVSKSAYLKSLKIVHCGNQPQVGKKLCKKYGVKNIEFRGEVDRKELCYILNNSKFGLCMSNKNDGCPRVVTEILMTGTPLILSDQTRLLPYYKKRGVIEVNDSNISYKIREGITYVERYKQDVVKAIITTLNFDAICQKNIDIWKNVSS
jgi:glycosyltransferase involved in cell wall biosynthesis